MNARNDKGKRGGAWFVVALSTFALLIWAKLRLVTGVPRSAYADPKQVESPKPAPEKDAPASPVPAARQ